MGVLHGALGIPDADRSFIETIGQRPVFDAVQTVLGRYNAEMQSAMQFFVSGTTTDHTWRYYLPGNGYMQEHNFSSIARPHAVKASGSWDVALPIKDFRDSIIEDDIEMAYMTVDQLDRHVSTILIRYANTTRREILSAIFGSTSYTFTDPIKGSLTIQRLANGDSVVYPPVVGSVTEATDNHYLESGYAYTAISDTNNPLITMRDELTEHFGITEGGENIVVLVNKRETPYLRDLEDWVPITDTYVTVGDQVTTLSGRPGIPPTARYVGRCDGVFVAEWDWMPEGYMVARHMNVEAPLMRRIDYVAGLGDGGLQLVSQDENYPLMSSIWRVRQGFGVTNRLNGVVMELGSGGTYTVPTLYQ